MLKHRRARRLMRYGAAGVAVLVSFMAGAMAFAAAPALAGGTYEVYVNGAQFCALPGFSEAGSSAAAPFTYGCDSAQPSATITAPVVQDNDGDGGFLLINVPPAFTLQTVAINSPTTPPVDGYDALAYWADGDTVLGSQDWSDVNVGQVNNYTYEGVDGATVWGMQLYCGQNSCAGDSGTTIGVNGLVFYVNEAQSPSLSESGFWNQGGWVWNAPGDSWSTTLAANDPSGICSLQLNVGEVGQPPQTLGPPNAGPDLSTWQQCPEPMPYSVAVDTSKYIPQGSSGQLAMTASATDAASNTTPAKSTDINVDNITPTISIAQDNDTDPTGAGNSAPAQLQITATAGPSGISAVDCSVDGGQAQTMTGATSATSTGVTGTYDMSLDDTSSHSVVCSVANNAVNPQGQNNTATTPAFTVRADTTSTVSFQNVVDALKKKTIKERVRVGYHYVTRREHGMKIKVKKGGHFVTKKVTKYVEHCTVTRTKVKTKKHKTKTEKHKSCTPPSTTYTDTTTVPNGQPTTFYGVLTNAQGVGVAGKTVTISVLPANGDTTPNQIEQVTTDSAGGWSAPIPAGPSQTITATFAGDSTDLASSATGTMTVPAKIDLSISPRKVPWGKPVMISGQLEGGFVPPHGVAMRILIKIPGLKKPYASSAFRTSPTGAFSFAYVAPAVFKTPKVYPIAVSMVGAEDDYPFAAATSSYLNVKYGVKTPKNQKSTKTKKHGTKPPKTKKGKGKKHHH